MRELLRTVEAARADVAAFNIGHSIDREAAYVLSYLGRRGVPHSYAANREQLARLIAAQVARYRGLSPEENQTLYGKVMVRWHTERSARFNELWWREYVGGVPRDQLSMRYCMREATRQAGLVTASLGAKGRHSPLFRRHFRISSKTFKERPVLTWRLPPPRASRQHT